MKKLARIIYDGSHKIGEGLARNLTEAAEKSVGAHHSEPYRVRIKYLCEDLDVLRRRLKDLARDVGRRVDEHEIGKLIITIEGVGPLTAACLIAELGDPARFDSAGGIADFDNAAWPRFDIQFWPHPDVFLIAPRFGLMGWTQPSLLKTASTWARMAMNHHQEERGRVRKWILERWASTWRRICFEFTGQTRRARR